MSAIFGIFNRSGEPVASRDVDAMRDASRPWGRDGGGVWSRDAAALGCCLRHSTAEAVHERLPVADDQDGFAFTSEGRLDNRDELFAALDIAPSERATVADGELMRRAYRVWREQAVTRLLGDWSFAAWHFRERRLFVARDHYGVTAVRFALTPQRFAFASSIHALLALPWLDRRLNDVKLAGTLLSWGPDEPGTFFAEINLLPPAHVMTVTPDRVEMRRYWRMEDTPEIELPSERDYVETFRAALAKAVQVRLRGVKPASTMLSGGLDSSSITVLAARELRASGRRLHSYTWVPAYQHEPRMMSRFTNEGPYAAEVAAMAGNVDSVLVPGQVGLVEAMQRMVDVQAAPYISPANAPYIDQTFQDVADSGAGALLTGDLGNGTISWDGIAPEDWSYQVRMYGLLAAIRTRFIQPLVPAGLVQLYRRKRYGEIPWGLRYSPINRDFAQRLKIDLADAGPDAELVARDAMGSRQVRCMFLSPDRLQLGAYLATMEGAYGIDIRVPAADKEFAELCFAIPDRVFSGGGRMRRWLIRETMRDLLPDSVRLNLERGYQGADLVARLRAQTDSIDAALVAAEGNALAGEILDLKRMRTAWELVRTQDGVDAWREGLYALLVGLQTAIFLDRLSPSIR